MNRTTEINPDGSFVINNVPAAGGLVRVRVVCTGDSGVRGGISDFVLPLNGQTIDAGFIAVATIPPRLKSMALAAGTGTLTMLGASTQTSAVATLGDNTTLPVDGAANGTSYITSNAAVCTVTPAGLVMAGSTSGTCIVTAVHEGLLASALITIRTAPDADGDGLPDDFEARYSCLNPAANDAGADPDGDTLTNAQEYQRGTDPCAADSDSDGLGDGDEVARGTNPASPDSDLDGLIDGEEVRLGANPLNRDSDGDGLPDGVEVALVGNPTGAVPTGDNDGDGLTNLDEIEAGTNPARADTDGDGLNDAAEIVTQHTDPLKGDTDGDGYGDGFEVALGSNPLVAASLPVIRPANAAAGGAVAVYNTANPALGTPLPGAAAGLAVSVYNTANPAIGTTIPGAAAGSAVSVYNTASPAQGTVIPGAAAGPAVSVYNTADPGLGAALPGAAAGLAVSVYNEGGP